MSPRQEQDIKEDSPLINKDKEDKYHQEFSGYSMEWARNQSSSSSDDDKTNSSSPMFATPWSKAALILLSTIAIFGAAERIGHYLQIKTGHLVRTGPYKLLEVQEGKDFFSYYDFFDGPDSLGSAGYNMYVSESTATRLNIASVVNEKDTRTGKDEDFVYMSSSPTKEGPRNSVRLEGKTRFDRGLFILDVRHMPDGPGIWPAFWMTDEAAWPRNGEVDILEGVNGQTTAKTALHTSDKCDMYAHVAEYAKTGDWEWITGIPDTFTGLPDYNQQVPSL